MPGPKLPAATKAAGVAFGATNPCLTPSATGQVPMLYVSVGQLPAANGVEDTVLIENKEVIVESSKIPNSQGDNLGVGGGLTSGVNMNEIQIKQATGKVSAGGQKMTHVTARTAHNGSNPNCPVGLIVAPSQDKVLIGLG